MANHLASERGVTRRVLLRTDGANVGLWIEDADCRIDRIQAPDELAERVLRALNLAGDLGPLAGQAA
jgi:hypothetical protein